ncbi:Abi family protein [Fluoribacter gormanii]|uniref:Abi family protein n=1 Tax=Fluoribacter gormanii TaxID=464 RepID=UPI00224403A9|nr:Abi family protein [Fluoribacter gormanii]MCW8444571.1 Abi family protein [Fluoribacter gormanii]MCW8469768.1 Abi family protein [Fluoribacter gormanii]
MSHYNKPYLTFEQQLELLKSRGLGVTNDKVALEYLGRLGYYRLSGYWYPCRKLLPLVEQQTKSIRPRRSDEFLPGSRFQDVVDLYVFDKKLRLLILDAIERIEVAFRVDIAYLLGERDPFAYTNPDLLHGHFTKKIDPNTGKTKYQEWISKHEQLINRSKEDFVEHYKAKYGLPLPIWVAIELWDFGLLSVFYKGMAVKDKAIIANKYDIPDWQIMESWLRSLNYVRNVAAHHSRLWNRNLIDQPKLAKPGAMLAFDSFIDNVHMTSRVYVVLCILAHYMKIICPRSTWQMRLVELIHSFPNSNYVSIQDMGFPAEWEQHIFWKN